MAGGRFVPDAPQQAGGRFVPDAAPAPKAPQVTDTPQGEGTSALSYMDPRGPFEAAASMASGMAGQALGGYAGLAGAALPGPEGQGARWAENVSKALTYTPRSKSGEVLLKAAELPAIPINWAAEKVGEQGAKTSPALGTIGETSVKALPILLGARSATAPTKPLTAAEQKVAAARDAGFVMTPEEMGAGVVPRTAASIAGEPRLAKLTSRKNVGTATAKAKAELSIRPDAPLDLDTLSLIRKQEGTKYDVARGAGQMQLDATYLADLDNLAAKHRNAANEFPGLKSHELRNVVPTAPVEQVIAALRKDDPAIAAAQAQGIKLPASVRQSTTADAGATVDLIGTLRESADKAFRSGDTGLAKVMRGGAEALEAQLERHLAATGQSDVLTAFRAARERIAKTYAVEKALVGEQVNPQALGRQVQKRKPLTGGLKETGEFARTFERSSMKPTHMPTGASYADIALGLLNSLRSGGGSLALDALTFGARPIARSMLASRPAQFAMDPRTNLSGPALQAVGASSALPPPQEEKR